MADIEAIIQPHSILYYRWRESVSFVHCGCCHSRIMAECPLTWQYPLSGKKVPGLLDARKCTTLWRLVGQSAPMLLQTLATGNLRPVCSPSLGLDSAGCASWTSARLGKGADFTESQHRSRNAPACAARHRPRTGSRGTPECSPVRFLCPVRGHRA